MKKLTWFWVSWYWTKKMGDFTLFCPWWIMGTRGEDDHIVHAAVPAETEDEARNVVRLAYDKAPRSVEWRSCNEGDTPEPYSERRPKAKWMKWPPEKRSQGMP